LGEDHIPIFSSKNTFVTTVRDGAFDIVTNQKKNGKVERLWDGTGQPASQLQTTILY
jgi:hypothetical protein